MIDGTAAPSGVYWLIVRSVAPICCCGTHSPAKNISGKNRIPPIAPATRWLVASDAISRPRDAIAVIVSRIARMKPMTWLGQRHVVGEVRRPA